MQYTMTNKGLVLLEPKKAPPSLSKSLLLVTISIEILDWRCRHQPFCLWHNYDRHFFQIPSWKEYDKLIFKGFLTPLELILLHLLWEGNIHVCFAFLLVCVAKASWQGTNLCLLLSGNHLALRLVWGISPTTLMALEASYSKNFFPCFSKRPSLG